jgi:hypothetical protein
MKMEGRVVWITGASSGIGEAAARAFARRGACLALTARRKLPLETLAEELRVSHPGLDVLALPMDVTRLASLEDGCRRLQEHFGRVDLLVSNAGVGIMDFLDDLDPQQGISAQINTNLTGTILASRLVIPGMKQRRSGQILLVASLASWIGTPGYSVYAASKFGVRGFAEALRRELRPWGVHVSVLYPGPVANGFGQKSEVLQAMVPPRPPGFVSSSAQVAEAIVQLAERPRRSKVIPARYLPALWLNALAPGLADLFIGAFFRGLAPAPNQAPEIDAAPAKSHASPRSQD